MQIMGTYCMSMSKQKNTGTLKMLRKQYSRVLFILKGHGSFLGLVSTKDIVTLNLLEFECITNM